MQAFLIKIVDTNGVVSEDRVFLSREEAESYVREEEKKSNGWELQIFQCPLEVSKDSN
ncbi:MAG: hypothetical protein ACOWWO_16280 [Peptococcaceae bacterium]